MRRRLNGKGVTINVALQCWRRISFILKILVCSAAFTSLIAWDARFHHRSNSGWQCWQLVFSNLETKTKQGITDWWVVNIRIWSLSSSRRRLCLWSYQLHRVDNLSAYLQKGWWQQQTGECICRWRVVGQNLLCFNILAKQIHPQRRQNITRWSVCRRSQ